MTNKPSITSLIDQLLAGVEMNKTQLADADWDSIVDAQLRDDAWLTIQQWISDRDIREKDEEYVEMRRLHLLYLLRRIQS